MELYCLFLIVFCLLNIVFKKQPAYENFKVRISDNCYIYEQNIFNPTSDSEEALIPHLHSTTCLLQAWKKSMG